LKTIELIPLDRINRKLYQENFSQLVSFFEKKFPGKVSKKIGDLKLKGVDFVELDNQYRKSIKYKFYNKIDLGKYKQLYLNSLKNDKSNSEI
jgi:hypothetical protein